MTFFGFLINATLLDGFYDKFGEIQKFDCAVLHIVQSAVFI